MTLPTLERRKALRYRRYAGEYGFDAEQTLMQFEDHAWCDSPVCAREAEDAYDLTLKAAHFALLAVEEK